MLGNMSEACMYGQSLCNDILLTMSQLAFTAIPACCACCVASDCALLTRAPFAEDMMQDPAWLCNDVLCIAKYICVSCTVAELC